MAKKPTKTSVASGTVAPLPIHEAHAGYRIAHRTVSIPEGAHPRLVRLQELVRDNGGINAVPEWLREFAQDQMGPGNANFTKGLIFWLSCEKWIAELESSLKLEGSLENNRD